VSSGERLRTYVRGQFEQSMDLIGPAELRHFAGSSPHETALADLMATDLTGRDVVALTIDKAASAPPTCIVAFGIAGLNDGAAQGGRGLRREDDHRHRAPRWPTRAGAVTLGLIEP